MTASVQDARPPLILIRVMNPIMRTVLRTPLGRFVRPFALLDFTGRRTGRRYRIPVGWHPLDGGWLVSTPAPWRANFAGGAAATVRHRGRSQEVQGVLIADRATVATLLQQILDAGASARDLGMKVPGGHRLTAADVEAVDRAVIRFEPAA